MKTKKTTDSKANALLCAKAALDKKAENCRVLHVGEMSSLTDYFVVCSGTSDRQVQAIANSITDTLRASGTKPLATEGVSEGRWALLDFGSVVVHVFLDSIREYYNLEGLWDEAPKLPIPSEYYGGGATPIN